MASTTVHYGLRKPDPADVVNVTTDISGNMDLIDTAIHSAVATTSPDLSPYLKGATSFTTTTMTNPIGGGNMTVLVFPANNAALAVALSGEAYPRLLMAASPNDGWYFGDGTFDPYASGANFFCSGNDITFQSLATFTIETSQAVHFTNDLINDTNNTGLILRSPNNTKYRITVNNDGSLSTTLVP